MFGWFKKDSPKMEPDDYSWNDKSWYYENKDKDIDKKYEENYKKALKASSDVIKKKYDSYIKSDVWTTITRPNTGSSAINVTPNTSVSIDLPLVVNGRNVMSEIDELKDALLILSRDLKLEEKYPELKEAYDNYMEIKRGLGIAEKLYATGKDNV